MPPPVSLSLMFMMMWTQNSMKRLLVSHSALHLRLQDVLLLRQGQDCWKSPLTGSSTIPLSCTMP